MNLSRPLLFLIAAHIIGLTLGAFWWNTLTASKKRFFVHIGKQLPWLPFRYFA